MAGQRFAEPGQRTVRFRQRPPGHHNGQPTVGDALHQVPQQLEGRRVCPVQVLDPHQQRSLRRGGDQSVRDGLPQTELTDVCFRGVDGDRPSGAPAGAGR